MDVVLDRLLIELEERIGVGDELGGAAAKVRTAATRWEWPVPEPISLPRCGNIMAARERECPRPNSEMTFATTYNRRLSL
jgi:hypothetical protein